MTKTDSKPALIGLARDGTCIYHRWPLELAFANRSLRHICESESKAKRVLGVEVARTLKHRLADLRAAISIEDLVAGRPHELQDSHSIEIEIDEGVRLTFCANHNKEPLLPTGQTDWSKVRRVKILRIEGHDE